MLRRGKLLLATIGLLLMIGVGCTDADVDRVIHFVKLWLIVNNVTDEDGNPSAGAMAFVATGGFIPTGSPDGDAIVGAGNAVRNIARADEQLGRADEAMAKIPPDTQAAINAVDEAERLRPNDPHVRHRRGVILLQSGNVDAARNNLSTYSTTCETIPGVAMGEATRERCLRRLEDEYNATAGRPNAPVNCRALRVRIDATARMRSLETDEGIIESLDVDSRELNSLYSRTCL
jgi:hypothetical protein